MDNEVITAGYYDLRCLNLIQALILNATMMPVQRYSRSLTEPSLATTVLTFAKLQTGISEKRIHATIQFDACLCLPS
jgi:hypothetical protein